MAGRSPAKGIFGCVWIVEDNRFPSTGQPCVGSDLLGRARSGVTNRAIGTRASIRGIRSKNGFDIGLHEIIADIEEAAGMLLRHCIGEAIAKV